MKKVIQFNEQEIICLIVGFYRDIFNRYIPDDLLGEIIQFYCNCMLFSIFDSNGNTVIDCCESFSFNKISLMTVKNNKLCTKGYKSNNEWRIFDYFVPGNIILYNKSVTSSHFFISQNDILYSIEWNKNTKTLNIPQRIEFTLTDTSLKKICCGSQHTLLLTQNGNVYGSGKNNCGQLSSICESDAVDELTLIFDKCNIIDIGCAVNSSYILYDNSLKYMLKSFGSNQYFALGTGATSTLSMIPRLIDNNVISFDCGNNHGGFIRQNSNEIYMFGENEYYFQCGLGVTINCQHPNKIRFRNITGYLIDIKCGESHNIIKTSKNNYYSFGSNIKNELLLKNIHAQQVSKPQLISNNYIHNLVDSYHTIIDLIPGINVTYIIQNI